MRHELTVRRPGGVAICGFSAFCIFSTLYAIPAAAYRTVNERQDFAALPYAVTWADGPIQITAWDDSGSPTLATATRAVLETWSQAECAGSSRIQLVSSAAGEPPEVGDGLSSIQFVSMGWTSSHGFAANAPAVTELRYATDPQGVWRIVEADIFLNREGFDFADTQSATARDLIAVLNHEMLHVLGVLHCCEPGGADGAPSCESDPAFASLATYPLYTGASQRVLAPDDVAALCTQLPREACGQSCPGGTICSGSVCLDVCGGEVCTSGEACVEGTCRDHCGETLCAAGDTCVSGACRAECAGLVCVPGQLCGPNGCQVDDCDHRAGTCESTPRDCDAGTPCPAGMTCEQIGSGAAAKSVCLTGEALSYCEGDGACPADAWCVRGVCRIGAAQLFDPCTLDGECASAHCVEGTCRLACTDAGQCGTRGVCEPKGAGSFCALGGASFGAPCQDGAACASRACVVADLTSGTCSRSCNPIDARCPNGFECAAVDGEDVCVPQGTGSCSAAPGRRPSSPVFIVLLGLTLLVRFRRRIRISP